MAGDKETLIYVSEEIVEKMKAKQKVRLSLDGTEVKICGRFYTIFQLHQMTKLYELAKDIK